MNAVRPGSQKAIGYFALAMLAIYLVLSLWLIAFPRAVFITPKITRYYKWIALPGPYFKEERIRSMGRFYIAYKPQGGVWSAWRNVERENFEQYHSSFFDYADLKRSRMERFMAQKLKTDAMAHPGKDVKSLRAFQRMHAYLRPRYLPGDTDSVRWLYLKIASTPTAQTDTLVNITYKMF